MRADDERVEYRIEESETVESAQYEGDEKPHIGKTEFIEVVEQFIDEKGINERKAYVVKNEENQSSKLQLQSHVYKQCEDRERLKRHVESVHSSSENVDFKNE